MELNSFIFPAPKSTYNDSSYDNLFWIPTLTQEGIASQIPCLYFQHVQAQNKTILYFHGNAEDLGQTEIMGHFLSQQLKMNVICIEYPEYGVYNGEISAEQILTDAEQVLLYFNKEMRVQLSKIYLMGRSIGSGPATYLASKYNVGGLILLAAFCSLREVVGDFVGDFLKYVVAERFLNKDNIKNVESPICFIHGKKDSMVPYAHSVNLQQYCYKAYSYMYLSETMSHNEFSIIEDIVKPVQDFFSRIATLPLKQPQQTQLQQFKKQQNFSSPLSQRNLNNHNSDKKKQQNTNKSDNNIYYNNQIQNGLLNSAGNINSYNMKNNNLLQQYQYQQQRASYSPLTKRVVQSKLQQQPQIQHQHTTQQYLFQNPYRQSEQFNTVPLSSQQQMRIIQVSSHIQLNKIK